MMNNLLVAHRGFFLGLAFGGKGAVGDKSGNEFLHGFPRKSTVISAVGAEFEYKVFLGGNSGNGNTLDLGDL